MPRNVPEFALGAELTIARIGHLGDGVADAGGVQVLVPFAAPGDRVRWDGDTWQIVSLGAAHQKAPCPHFGVCGGCSLQHLTPQTYAEAKRDWVIAALANQGLETEVDELVTIAPGTRRRAAFTIRRTEQGLEAGFLARRGDEVVAIPDCLILRPKLRDALPKLANLIGARLKFGRAATATVTDAIGGFDVAVEAQDKVPSFDPGAAGAAREAGVARLTWNGEIVAVFASPRVELSGVTVELPPGAFLQATAEAEAHLVARVRDVLKGAKMVADLYAGLGTFTFALAAAAKVSAFESEQAAVEALIGASRHAQGLKPIVGERRDLVRRPLMSQELKRFDGAVIDPPRAGAEAQARALAKSGVPAIAYVSCHPASFARDARLLVEGGYKLVRVTPVDQFVWSHHVELVGEFVRPRR